MTADEDDPARVFVLLDAATKFAVDAGDLPLALQAVDQQAATFAVDLQDKRLDILKEIAKSGSPATATSVVEMLLSEADKFGNNGEFQAATALISIAQATARRVKDHAGQQAAATRLSALRESEKRAAKIAPLIERLKTNPEDREAASLLGKHRCFVEGNWVAGLPLLARGDDSSLARLACLDTAAESDTTSRLRAADAWWEIASDGNSAFADAADQRARFHYGHAIGGLQGLERARVEQRLRTPEKTPARRVRPKELLLWLDPSISSSITTVIGSGSPEARLVSRWSDVKGIYSFGQTSYEKMPRLVSDPVSKRPAVAFSAGSFLQSAFKPNRTGTAVLVLRPSPAANANMVPLGCKETGSGVQFRFYSDGRPSFRIVRNGPDYDLVDCTKVIAANPNPLILFGTWPDPFALLASQEVAKATRPATADPSSGHGTVLGARSEEGTYPYDGLICELMIFSVVLPDAEITRLRGELTHKWSSRR